MPSSDKGLHIDSAFYPWENIALEQNSDIPEVCRQWMRGEEYLSFKSSGSTGKARPIRLSRSQLEYSALASKSFLNLQEEEVLCCLPTDKTGGAMLLIRCMIFNWNCHLVSPKGNPMISVPDEHNFSLMSLVPLQLEHILHQPTSLNKLMRFGHVLIGGAAISKTIEMKLQQLNPSFYHTYGMTETASHIALRKMNGKDRSEWFSPLPGIETKTDNEQRLMIKGPVTEGKWLQTQDVVEWREGRFRVLGRADFTINSGGIKIQPEQLEKQLSVWMQSYFPGRKYVISSRPHPQLGEEVVLLIEGRSPTVEFSLPDEIFEAYHKPRVVLFSQSLPFSDTGKPLRQRISEWLNS